MIVTSVQIKTAKTQKHLYCPVFTSRGYKKDVACKNPDFIGVFIFFRFRRCQIDLTSVGRYSKITSY